MGTRIDEVIQKRSAGHLTLSFSDGGHCGILSWHPRDLFFAKEQSWLCLAKKHPSHILKTNLKFQPILNVYNIHDIWGDLNMVTCIVHINASFSRRSCVRFHETSVAPNFRITPGRGGRIAT